MEGEEARAPLLQPRGEAAGGAATVHGRARREALKWWVESKKLWQIVGPAILQRIALYAINVVSQAFIGHLGDLELAAFSIAATVVAGFNFGFLDFRISSTEVKVGNGQATSFWQDSWLSGKAPMDIAPNLFSLAWRKNKKVSEELVNLNWTRGLWRMESTQQLEEFINLWDLLESVVLSDQPDRIRWKWTADGSYTAKSAYLIQFQGTVCSFKANKIWKAHAEGKHKFFTWLLVQAKILTADKLIVRQWPCNPICPLCDQENETALHLCLKCPFALEVWEAARVWSNGLILPPSADTASIEDWWALSIQNTPKSLQRTVSGILMYTAWNIWKERNRRVFNGKQASSSVVFSLTKDEMGLRVYACGQPCLA